MSNKRERSEKLLHNILQLPPPEPTKVRHPAVNPDNLSKTMPNY